jgi:hypothetical protein
MAVANTRGLSAAALVRKNWKEKRRVTCQTPDVA